MVVVHSSLMALLPFHFQRDQARRPNRLNPSSNKQTVQHPQTENPYGGAVLKTTVVVRSSLMAWLAFHCQRGCSPITVNSSTVFFHTLNAPSLYSTMALCKIIISHQFWRLQYFKLALVCSSWNNLIFALHGYLRVSRLSVSDCISHVYQQYES